ncbi:hypothetical protein HDU87_006444 [Geranomyces variabilis]|uniref:RING-type E3 ubiquitin transferase n=1 Tax=Geranomyces variabilis TaxID=109894 RepID=A0AAD5TGE9_9FUNG|nr:hypothetical protein HDU87_006444 [Geranomyces variabilis]
MHSLQPLDRDPKLPGLWITDYRQGNCRFGAYCALAHVKQQPAAKAGISSLAGARSSTGKLVADVAPNQVLTSTGRTYIPASEALARATTVVKTPPPPPPAPSLKPDALPFESSASQSSSSASVSGVDSLVRGVQDMSVKNSSPWAAAAAARPRAAAERTAFKSDVPWPSDYPDDEEASEEFDEEEGDYYEDENGVRWGAPTEDGGYQTNGFTTPYAAAARAGLTEEDFTSAPTPAGIPVANTSAGPEGGRVGSPLCPFAMQGNCRFGERCRYRHGLACPVCGKQCLDPDSDPQVHAEHIERCHERQEREARHDAQVAESADVDCVVCMETVKSKADPRFGLLDCEHCVCLNCIRQWRTNERMDTSKSCPICRTVTHFVTPSAIWPTDAETKAEIVEAYKTKLGTINCKHYNRGEGSCPFGTSCFYRHVGRDGMEEEVKLRKVMGNDAEGLTIVGAVKLADFLDAYEGRA